METVLKMDKVEVVITNLQDVRIGNKRVTLEFPNCKCKNTTVRHIPENSGTFRIECKHCGDMGWLQGEVYHFKLEDTASTRFTDTTPVPEFLANIPLTLKLARKLNRRWAQRFGLKKLKVVMWTTKKIKKMIEKHKFEIYGHEQPIKMNLSITEGIHHMGMKRLIIKKEVDAKRHWGIFIHEVAHYREKRHGEEFREEMVAVGRYFQMLMKKPKKAKVIKDVTEAL